MKCYNFHMRKHRLFTRLISITVVLLTLLGGLSGCKRPGEQDTVDKFISFMQSAEYPRIYELLTEKARSSISLVNMSMRYQNIYDTIGLKKTVCKLKGIKTVNDEDKVATFTLTMTAEKLGDFTLEMTAPLRWESGKWLIDWTPGLILPGLEDGDSAQLKIAPASRGEIFDATGEVLAKNDHALSVYVNTSQVKNYETTIRLLAPELGMTESEVRQKLKPVLEPAASPSPSPSASPAPSPSASPSPTATQSAADSQGMSYVIKAYPKDGLTQEQQDKLKDIPGVGIDGEWMTTIRTYPYGDMLAQTLGYTGMMNEAQLTKPENAGLPQDAVIGQTGLEAAFEKDLRGQPGYDLIIVDSLGNVKTTLAHKAESDGHDLRLTIDIKLQMQAEMLLRQYLSPEMAGTVIVLDPKTGYIQAMASAPSFDPNLFSFPIDAAVWKQLNDPASMDPFMNRATDARYAPGSTFKPFTAMMGLEDHAITTGFVFPYEIKDNLWTPGDQFGIDKPIKRKDPTPGDLNLRNAITYSDNIYFAYTALKVGGQKFYQHCLDLGFTAKMPFDLPTKTSSITNSGKLDNPRTLADSGYGQGELWITPVQMAALFGSLDNGGDIMLPRLVSSICHTDGPRYVVDKTNATEVWMQGVVPQSILNILIPDLKLVAQKGTASALNTTKLKPYEICAKTGTAEVGNDKTREIAWLMGFMTKTMDRLVCVTIEVPAGTGSSVRTDIARGMFEADASPTGTDTPENTAGKK